MKTEKLICELEKKIKKDFGKPCKQFSFGCFICGVFLALNILEDLKDMYYDQTIE